MAARRSRAVLLCAIALGAVLFSLLQKGSERGARAEPSASSSSTPAKPSPTPGKELEVGSVVRLRARHELGVPLHPAPDAPSVSARLPDGASARILSIGTGGRWFEIESNGERGFVTRRYLDHGAASTGPALRKDSPWSSRETCLLALKQPRPPRDPKRVRVGAWNLHWFPDGRPGTAKPGAGADLEWLACAITLLEIDVLAIEEIKHGPGAEQALTLLRARLGALAGGSYRTVLDDCPRGASQHVGFLYDERRARLVQKNTLAELNPHGEPCKDQLRPGLAGSFAFPGGLDVTLVAVHLKSGPDARALALRERSFGAFTSAADHVRKLTQDGDVLVLGDMNTMGCESCAVPVTAADELASQDRRLGAAGFRRIASDPPVSHFYNGKATLLDWAAASDLAELPAPRRASVSGLCAELAGTPPRSELAAQSRLSDHCPFVLELDDRDED